MAVIRSSSRAAIDVTGVDLVVKTFAREALTAGVDAGALVVEYADKAAEMMRSTVPVEHGDVQASITADNRPTVIPTGVYAEAGPDLQANNQAFVAYWLEEGTANMPPRAFAGPAADELLPRFEKDIEGLMGL